MVAFEGGTSDGIGKSDWEEVEELAEEIAHLAESQDAERRELVDRLFGLLDRLEEKYGSKPSLMATRADYLDEDGRATLLEKAYAMASASKDDANKTLISSSLAELCINDLRDFERGAYWLERFGESLRLHSDKQEREIFERLSDVLRKEGGKAR